MSGLSGLELQFRAGFVTGDPLIKWDPETDCSFKLMRDGVMCLMVRECAHDQHALGTLRTLSWRALVL